MVAAAGGLARQPGAAGARRGAGIRLQRLSRSGAARQSAGALCAEAGERRADHHTAGVGASSAAASYPNRLAVELKQHFPNHSITVINRGVGGEEVGDMLRRFDTSVLTERPDLVLWQLGTNSVIRDDKLSDHDTSIRNGLKKIRAIGADAVLIDPQFAPKVIVKAGVASMVELIAATAKREDVDLFPRFNVMKHWSEVDHMAFERFVSPDGLHMNDWGYACMAKSLGVAIAEAAQRPVISAKSMSQLVR